MDKTQILAEIAQIDEKRFLLRAELSSLSARRLWLSRHLPGAPDAPLPSIKSSPLEPGFKAYGTDAESTVAANAAFCIDRGR